jgi:replicative DNA helicase
MSNILPFDHEAELGIIGCCVLGGITTSTDALGKVSGTEFSRDDCRQGIEVIADLVEQGQAVDQVTFGSGWHKRWNQQLPSELLQAPDLVGSAANLDHYVERVREIAGRRKIILDLDLVLNRARDLSIPLHVLLAEAEGALAGQDNVGTPLADGGKLAADLVDDVQARFDLQGRASGLVTGFSGLDRLTDGLQFGEQMIIAARPSMGKTAIGLNIVQRVCFGDRVPTLIITAEMSRNALMRRLMASIENLPLRTIRQGSFTNADLPKISAFKGRLSSAPLFVEEAVSGIETTRLGAIVRRACRQHGVKLVVIDYLQKIRPSRRHEKRTYEVGEVSETLKALAVQTGAAFLTLAQLNRESEKEKGRGPRLSDLADSGQIERDADTVGLLHRRRDDETGETKLIIAKQRDGELGVVDLHFNGTFCRFENPKCDVPAGRPELN